VPAPKGSGLSKSAASRHFVALSLLGLLKVPRRDVTDGVAYVVCDWVFPPRWTRMVSDELLREALPRIPEPKRPSARGGHI